MNSYFSGSGPTLIAKQACHENLDYMREYSNTKYLEPITDIEVQKEIKNLKLNSA